MKIVLNTLDTQHHQCKRIPATVVMSAPPSRSRGKTQKHSEIRPRASERIIANVSDVSQPSLGVEHELVTNEIDTETPPMRPPMVSVHQRSPGGMHGQMETHWEENNGPACRYFNKHFMTRSVDL